MPNFNRGDAVVVTGTGQQATFIRNETRLIAIVHFGDDLEGVESRVHVQRLSRAPLPVIDPNAPPLPMVTLPRDRLEELLEDLSVLKGSVQELEETVQSLLNY